MTLFWTEITQYAHHKWGTSILMDLCVIIYVFPCETLSTALLISPSRVLYHISGCLHLLSLWQLDVPAGRLDAIYVPTTAGRRIFPMKLPLTLSSSSSQVPQVWFLCELLSAIYVLVPRVDQGTVSGGILCPWWLNAGGRLFARIPWENSQITIGQHLIMKQFYSEIGHVYVRSDPSLPLVIFQTHCETKWGLTVLRNNYADS